MMDFIERLRKISLKQIISGLFIASLISFLVYLYISSVQGPNKPANLWEVQSIDTMKYSRDLAREKLKEATFDEEIDYQVSNIKEMGASHIALGTPYDEEFIPYLERWVNTARKYRLKVWFRGNFSGWEQWFNYEEITPEKHQELIETFIINNPQLFKDGDIFSPCTECENGVLGDPRLTGNVNDYKIFLVEEYDIANTAFDRIEKDVTVNFPMNGDVAELIMDKRMTQNLGGVVVVDHYVERPEQLAEDVRHYAKLSGGKVILGEIGVYIPGIHPQMNDFEQAEWLEQALTLLAEEEDLVGINYWVFSDGTTQLWEKDTRVKRKAADVLQNFYKPK